MPNKIIATNDIVRIHPDGGITTIARSGNSTQKWRKLKNGEDIGEAPKPTEPEGGHVGKYVRMGRPNWKKVTLGSTEMSKLTMLLRKSYHQPYINRNFATIEYKDLNGNIQYESFMSLGKGKKGHTEPQILTFLSDNEIPLENLQKLHTELRPCIDCVIDYPELQKPSIELTWDFGYDEIDQKRRLEYINSQK